MLAGMTKTGHKRKASTQDETKAGPLAEGVAVAVAASGEMFSSAGGDGGGSHPHQPSGGQPGGSSSTDIAGSSGCPRSASGDGDGGHGIADSSSSSKKKKKKKKRKHDHHCKEGDSATATSTAAAGVEQPTAPPGASVAEEAHRGPGAEPSSSSADGVTGGGDALPQGANGQVRVYVGCFVVLLLAQGCPIFPQAQC